MSDLPRLPRGSVTITVGRKSVTWPGKRLRQLDEELARDRPTQQPQHNTKGGEDGS